MTLTAMNSIVDELRTKYSADLCISIYQVDVGSTVQIANIYSEVQKAHGRRPDILVANAGYYGKRVPNIWDVTLDGFDQMMNVNLRALFHLDKGVIEHMRDQRWGRIVFTSQLLRTVAA